MQYTEAHTNKPVKQLAEEAIHILNNPRFHTKYWNEHGGHQARFRMKYWQQKADSLLDSLQLTDTTMLMQSRS